jgi:hypothetical protein
MFLDGEILNKMVCVGVENQKAISRLNGKQLKAIAKAVEIVWNGLACFGSW